MSIKTAVDQAGLNAGIKSTKDSVDKVNKDDSMSIKVQTSIDDLSKSSSLSDLRSNLKKLQGLALEIGDSSSDDFKKITRAIGDTKDKMGDLNTIISAQSGEPIENLRNSFTGLGQSIMSLDFKTAKAQFGVLTQSANDLTGGMFKGFNALGQFKSAMAGGSTATQALGTSMKGLGKAIIATGIGALVIAVVLLISHFDELKSSGGAIGVIFTKIGDIVGGLIQKLQNLSDQFGLTNIAAEKAAKATANSVETQYDKMIKDQNKALEIMRAKGEDTTKKEIEFAKARNKTLEKLSRDSNIYSAEQIAKGTKDKEDNIHQIQVLEGKQQKEADDAAKAAAEKAEAKRKENETKNKAARERELQDTKEYEKIEASIIEDFGTEKIEIEDRVNDIIKSGKEKNRKDAIAIVKEQLSKEYQDMLDQIEWNKQTFDNYKSNNDAELALIERFHINRKEIDDRFAKIRLTDKDSEAKDVYQQISEDLQMETDLIMNTVEKQNQIRLLGQQVTNNIEISNTKDNSYKRIVAEIDADESIQRVKIDNAIETQAGLDELRELGRISEDEYLQQSLQNEIAISDAKVKIAEDEVAKKKALADEINRVTDKTVEWTKMGMDALSNINDLHYLHKTKNLVKGSKEEQKYAKQSFENNKKMQIASSIIAGIQGAIHAITGAMTLGPIAGPIVGAIQVAAIALSTAANIAKIKATKFESSSPQSVSAPPAGGNLPTTDFTTGTKDVKAKAPEMNVIKVNVLESEITASQQSVKSNVEKATLK